jgi:ABC-2 type transport system ATP-binding protein
MAIIEVEHVSKAFAIPNEHRTTVREHVTGLLRPRRFETLRVLEDVSFAVRPGESLGIMGRNGSGKSTLMKIVCGVYQPDGGHVVVNAPLTPILELGVGWNFELDAYDNVMLIGSVMGLTIAEITQRMDEILAFAELERFKYLKLKHYSSGMAARLGYSVAFAAVRDVLVLDEIFAVGDAGFRKRCEDRYMQLRANGHTGVIVSHDARTISTFCDRALLLDGGRIVLEGTGREVVDRYVAMLTPQG